jgi:hypothetical protein
MEEPTRKLCTECGTPMEDVTHYVDGLPVCLRCYNEPEAYSFTCPFCGHDDYAESWYHPGKCIACAHQLVLTAVEVA